MTTSATLSTDAERPPLDLHAVAAQIREAGMSANLADRVETMARYFSAVSASQAPREREAAIREALAGVPAQEPMLRGMGHAALAHVHRQLGDGAAVVDDLQEVVVAYREGGGGDPELAAAVEALAAALECVGRLEEAARVRREEALPVLRRLGDDRGCVRVLGDLGRGLRELGRPHEAEKLARDELLPTARRTGDQVLLLDCLIALWAVLRDQEDHAAILALSRDEILPLAAAAEHGVGVATGAFAGAEALVALGRADEAVRWLRDVGVPAADHSKDDALRVLLRTRLGGLLASRSRHDRAGARRVLREALGIAEERGMTDEVAEVREALGALR